MIDRRRMVVMAVALVLGASACGSGAQTGGQAGPGPSAGDPSTDKLAQILARGTLVGYAELNYPPQSIAVEGVARPADTACGEEQLTAPEVTGYDVEVTKLLAERLGVEACFARPSFSTITGGNWGDILDIAFASASINADRMERLWMTQPYYAVPNYYFVASSSSYQTPEDLNGKEIGACAGCSHELYLRDELVIPGADIQLSVSDPKIVTFETEGPGLRAAAKGQIAAFLAAEPVGRALIDRGIALRAIEETAFTYYPTGLVDKSSGLSSAAFVDRVNEIIQEAHTDGTLAGLSHEWFGIDYTAAAAAYDIGSIEQTVE